MNKRTVVIVALAAAVGVVGIVPAVASGGGANPDHVTVLDGADRYETAAQIALSLYPASQATSTLYIANGDNLVDAMVLGGNVEAATVRKLLLVRRDEVPEPTRDALRQISHTELVFLGGDEAISPAVRAEVMSLTDNYAWPN